MVGATPDLGGGNPDQHWSQQRGAPRAHSEWVTRRTGTWQPGPTRQEERQALVGATASRVDLERWRVAQEEQPWKARIRAVCVESSESEGKPQGPFSPPRDPRPRPRNKAGRTHPTRPRWRKTNKSEPESPDPTAAADEAFVVLDEEPDYSGDEEPQPRSQRTWVYVRDLLDAAEGSAATAEDSRERVDPPQRAAPPASAQQLLDAQASHCQFLKVSHTRGY